MGYFTETMALFEFKGDAETAYASRNAAEKFSGDHKIGKAMYAAGKIAVNSAGRTTNTKEYLQRAMDSKKDRQSYDAINKDKGARDLVKGVIKKAQKNTEFKNDMDKYQYGSNKGATNKTIIESFGQAFAEAIM